MNWNKKKILFVLELINFLLDSMINWSDANLVDQNISGNLSLLQDSVKRTQDELDYIDD